MHFNGLIDVMLSLCV